MRPIRFIILLIIVSGIPYLSWAETVTYELTIAQEKIAIADAETAGMTINGGIPGPTLRFQEGDTARIHVHNE